MIRGYHEYKLIWNDPTPGEELHGVQNGGGKSRRFVVK